MRRWTLCALGLLGCQSGDAPPAATTTAASVPPGPSATPTCEGSPRSATVAPGTDPRHGKLGTWLSKLPAGEADRVLLSAAAVEAFNAQAGGIDGAWRDPLGAEIIVPQRATAQYDERFEWMEGKVDEGSYVPDAPDDWAAAVSIVRDAAPIDRVHMVISETPVWCAPLDSGLFKSPRDPAFDRNRCGSAHRGEWARAIRETTADGRTWTWVHLGHAVGWIAEPDVLTPEVSLADAMALREQGSIAVLRDGARTSGGRELRMGTVLSTSGVREDGSFEVRVPGAKGFEDDTVVVGEDSGFGRGVQALTRREAWRLALAELDRPYGWGGYEGNRDCSRLLRDVFVPFGLQLARHSAVQAKQGSESIEVAHLDEPQKRAVIREAAARGLVLLYMPGHIMLYLGEDDVSTEGGGHAVRMFAVSAISEFLEPCVKGDDMLNRLDRVAVTTLDIGRDTRKTAFIERITRLAVIGARDDEGHADSETSG